MATIWVHILWYLTQLLVNAMNNNIRDKKIRVAENQHRWQVIRRRQQLRRRQQPINYCLPIARKFGHLLLINVAHYMIFFDNKPDTTNQTQQLVLTRETMFGEGVSCHVQCIGCSR